MQHCKKMFYINFYYKQSYSFYMKIAFHREFSSFFVDSETSKFCSFLTSDSAIYKRIPQNRVYSAILIDKELSQLFFINK